jgi:hypothetical protein
MASVTYFPYPPLIHIRSTYRYLHEEPTNARGGEGVIEKGDFEGGAWMGLTPTVD